MKRDAVLASLYFVPNLQDRKLFYLSTTTRPL